MFIAWETTNITAPFGGRNDDLISTSHREFRPSERRGGGVGGRCYRHLTPTECDLEVVPRLNQY